MENFGYSHHFGLYWGGLQFVLNLPCEDSLFIGLCGFGKILFVLFALFWILVFCLHVYLQWRRSIKVQDAKTNEHMNRRVLIAGLLFSSIPLIYTVAALGTDPNLKPYALESLQEKGKAQIKFTSFSNIPIYDQETGKFSKMQLKGTIVVNKTGNYEIHPMRLIGIIPVTIQGSDDNQVVTDTQQYIEAGTPYEFEYLAIIRPLEITGKGYSPDYIEQIEEAEYFSWKILWRVDSYPPFPFYLLGIGAVAQVYPDNSGELANITHINNQFQTDNYLKNVFDIK